LRTILNGRVHAMETLKTVGAILTH
jgi:hypothetical protein